MMEKVLREYQVAFFFDVCMSNASQSEAEVETIVLHAVTKHFDDAVDALPFAGLLNLPSAEAYATSLAHLGDYSSEDEDTDAPAEGFVAMGFMRSADRELPAEQLTALHNSAQAACAQASSSTGLTISYRKTLVYRQWVTSEWKGLYE